MKKKKALGLKVGDKIYVQATHYTGKVKLIEPPLICGDGNMWLSGIGAEGLLVGCAPRFAKLMKLNEINYGRSNLSLAHHLSSFWGKGTV